MNKFPKVIIQILHFRDINDTLECLDSVFKLDYPNFEVLVIDNSGIEVAPEPKLLQFYDQGRIDLIKTDENKGFSGGHNIGFNCSIEKGADYIWVLNNDAIVLSDTLKSLVTDIESTSEIGAISPIIYYHGTENIQYLASIFNVKTKQPIYTSSFDELAAWESEQRSFFLWGTALLVRTSILKNIGFFDEKLFAYWEDADLCYRMLSNGYKTKVSIKSAIYHKVDCDNGVVRRQPHFYFYMIRNQLFYLRKHCTFFQLILNSRCYITDVLAQLLTCLNTNSRSCINGGLDGIYCGLIGCGGPWDKDIHMPKLLGVFFEVFSWRLYRLLLAK